jgi:hypothetical protein
VKLRIALLSVILAMSVSTMITKPANASEVQKSMISEDTSQSKHPLPILNVTPTNDCNSVKTDAPIQIILDSNAHTFNRYKNKFVKGKYLITLNNQPLQSTFDEANNQINVVHDMLQLSTTYTITISVKADANNSQNNSENGTYSFTFKTQSDLNYTILDLSTLSPDILNRYNSSYVYPQQPYQIIVALVSKIGDGTDNNPFRPWVEWAGTTLGWITLWDYGDEIIVKIYVPQ